LITIIVNVKKAKIENCPDSLVSKLYKFLSFMMPNYQYTDAYINNIWDGYVRKFSKASKTFPSGLLNRVKKFLKERDFEFKVIDKRPHLEYHEDLILKRIENFKFTLRDYQIDGVIKGINNPYMIFWWATSSGKTVLFSSLILALKDKNEKFLNTLILVTNKDLAAQHREELSSMLETEIGVIEEGIFKPKKITVAVINTLWILSKNKKNKKVINYLKDIKYLIGDECHRVISSKMMKDVFNLCTGTFSRHGFSGSPYSLTMDDMELECFTGPPLSRVSTSALIKAGYVSTPHIYFIKYFLDNSLLELKRRNPPYSTAYSQGIVKNNKRNNIITSIVTSEFWKKEKPSILVLVRMINHGKILLNLFKENGIQPDDMAFIHGSSQPNVRKKVKEDFRNKKTRLVIASQIWNEGIDIPSLDVLVKADGGGGGELEESRGIRSVIQQIGRVIRKPIDPEIGDVNQEKVNVVRIYDFYDFASKDLQKHSENRLKTYKMEKEFKIFIREVD